MKKIMCVFIILLFAFGNNAQQIPGKNHSKQNLNCKTCHTCEVPTKDDPCLILCPREKITTVFQKAEETPELIVINELSERYGPVYFSHKLHAQMSDMSGGCQGCHHFNTTGPILKCNSCHEPNRRREDVRLPDLKGAYHRQCMDCHREWSNETGCNSCHELKKNIKVDKKEVVKKYAGKKHPAVIEPTRIMYQTNSDKGKIVTFYHDDHSKKFGLSCTSCHKQESCTKCHDKRKGSDQKIKPVSTKLTFEQQHKNCISCHSKNESCTNCHGDKVLEAFDHTKKTGWSLGKHHTNLACSKCHGVKLPYKKVDKKCVGCHGEWNKENFKHTVTGLQLDETHLELECGDCHADKNYGVKPTCDGCHEGYVYPKQKPGKLSGK